MRRDRLKFGGLITVNESYGINIVIAAGDGLCQWAGYVTPGEGRAAPGGEDHAAGCAVYSQAKPAGGRERGGRRMYRVRRGNIWGAGSGGFGR